MVYDPCYQGQSIGSISSVEKDFPSCFGQLVLASDWAEHLDEDAINMIKIGLGQLDEYSLSDKQFESLCEWLMETEDWTVVSQEEGSQIILPPSFRSNTISWRFM